MLLTEYEHKWNIKQITLLPLHCSAETVEEDPWEEPQGVEREGVAEEVGEALAKEMAFLMRKGYF